MIQKQKLVQKVEDIASKLGGRAELNFIGNYPATINSEKEAKEVESVAKNIVAEIVTDYTTMCAEDFSYFLEKVPGAMILVGCQQNEYFPQHNENFTVGINPILIGTQLFLDITKKYMM